MPAGAQDVHGLSDEFLADKPLFAERAEEFLEFIGDAQLVIHNAQFDLGFLNAELARVGKAKLVNAYIDTVSMARKQVPRPARQPRRAVRALRHRQFQPHQARRAARFGAAGRGLSRAERRPAARPRPRARDGGARHGRHGAGSGRDDASGPAACAEPGGTRRPRRVPRPALRSALAEGLTGAASLKPGAPSGSNIGQLPSRWISLLRSPVSSVHVQRWTAEKAKTWRTDRPTIKKRDSTASKHEQKPGNSMLAVHVFDREFSTHRH